MQVNARTEDEFWNKALLSEIILIFFSYSEHYGLFLLENQVMVLVKVRITWFQLAMRCPMRSGELQVSLGLNNKANPQ